MCFYLLYFAVDIFVNPLLIGISTNLITQGLLFTLTAVWRSGGFLAQMFNRRTALEPTTKLSYEVLHPPLRQTAVSSSFQNKTLNKFP